MSILLSTLQHAVRLCVFSLSDARLHSPRGAAPQLQLQVLELQHHVSQLTAALADREDQLMQRAQELQGLSTTVLAKEQMLHSARGTITDAQTTGHAESMGDGVTQASRNIMMQELERVKAFACQVGQPAPSPPPAPVASCTRAALIHECTWC